MPWVQTPFLPKKEKKKKKKYQLPVGCEKPSLTGVQRGPESWSCKITLELEIFKRRILVAKPTSTYPMKQLDELWIGPERFPIDVSLLVMVLLMLKERDKLGMVAHICNPSWDGEGGSSRPAWANSSKIASPKYQSKTDLRCGSSREHLLCKHEDLSSNPGLEKTNKTKVKKRERMTEQ
jgi:hypothetical protein